MSSNPGDRIPLDPAGPAGDIRKGFTKDAGELFHRGPLGGVMSEQHESARAAAGLKAGMEPPLSREQNVAASADGVGEELGRTAARDGNLPHRSIEIPRHLRGARLQQSSGLGHQFT